MRSEPATTPGEFRPPAPPTAAREILLSHNHIALLHGLYDRPGGRAASRVEWLKAATPYATRMMSYWSPWCLRRSMITMPSECVTQQKSGQRMAAVITNVGRAILEGRLAARVRGRGSYKGLASVDATMMVAQRSSVPGAVIREAVAYASAYGLPLIDSDLSTQNDGRLFAVTSGLDRPFKIMCLEELKQRGPRQWHWEWTREMIGRGHVPHGYLEEFSEYEYDDVLCHLKGLREEETDFATYMKVYSGSPFLSHQKVTMFLEQEIDLASTDMDSWHITEQVRRRSPTYQKALTACRSQSAWLHPDTGVPIGSAFRRPTEFSTDDVIVSSCAGLSCLQKEWDYKQSGLHIETRYLPR